MKTTLKKLRFHIPVMIIIIMLSGVAGYYIGFEPSSTDGTVKKTEIANATKNDDSEVSSDYIDPKTIADKSVQIKQSDFNKVFPSKKTEDTTYKAFIPDKYLGILNQGDPKNADSHRKGELYINIYATPEVLERLRRGYSLEQGQDIDLTI